MAQNFKQDLSKEERSGGIFIVKLLFREAPSLPDKERLTEVMKKRIGEIDCFWHDEKGAGITAKDYICHFKDADVPPQLMITDSTKFDGGEFDEFTKSQFWDCPNSDEILSRCKYQVIATDMMAAALPAAERSDLDMDFTEGLAELYPDCEAVFFFNSGKLFKADDLRNHNIPREQRFVRFAVNARFFNIEGTKDMIVDTLGMGVLCLPDLQYHFCGFDPNIVVDHAYNIALYILNSGKIIENGDTVDSAMENGEFNGEVMWKCSYESALIQPKRPVIDVFMNQYAAGTRDNKKVKERK
ncbi:MAG: DUF4261 domain-containing protein [[Eubacterium] siraeum]|nr:DUF4261 domain-containing protein [[Eubacterium] siraeum]